MKVQQSLWSSLGEVINAHRIELFEEYLEIHRLPVGNEEPTMVPYLRERFQNMPPNVVVSVGSQAFDFSNEWMDQIFPDAVQVFSAVREDQMIGLLSGAEPVGVLNQIAVQPLVEAITELLPRIEQIILVGGSAPFDRAILNRVRELAEGSFPGRISELSGEAPDLIAEKLSRTDPGSVVLFTTYFKDAAGTTLIPRNVVERISAESAVPVFALFDTMLGSGVTGVAATSFLAQGEALGEVLERIVSGEKPAEIGIVPCPPPRFLFDKRALKRYGLDLRRLPPNAEIFFDDPSFFEAHPVAFAVGSATIVIQTALILALLLARRRQRRAESRASEMERYFSTVFRESPNPMAILETSKGCFRDINPAWETLFGFSKHDLIGRSPLDIGLLPNESDDVLYRDFLELGPSFAGYERRMGTASGQIKSIALYSNVIEIAGERLCIVTALDSSDRIEAEKLRSNLARDNRTAQLGQISTWIAHEINQPLGSIQNDAETALMLLENGEGSSNEFREILADIKSENRRASGIVRQVRSMLGDIHTSGGPIAVGELLGDVSRSASPEAARRSVDLVLPDSGSAEGFLLGDRVLLAQVFLNLIFNAMDAVAEVPLSRRSVTLGYEILPEESMIEFSVADRGPGIEPGERESIFEFFHTTKEDGLGIGLAISRAIVIDHLGKLSVENLDEGVARFRVKLPFHEELP